MLRRRHVMWPTLAGRVQVEAGWLRPVTSDGDGSAASGRRIPPGLALIVSHSEFAGRIGLLLCGSAGQGVLEAMSPSN